MPRFSLRTLFVVVALVAITIAGVRWMCSPSGHFFFSTGFLLPLSAKVISSGNSRGGFHGDGTIWLIAELHPETLRSWAGSDSPWGFNSKKWCESKYYFGTMNAPPGKSDAFQRALSSPNTLYARRWPDQFCTEHQMLVLDVDASRVWFTASRH